MRTVVPEARSKIGRLPYYRAMKFLPLILAGLRRKPVRTLFTGVSIAIAFVLIGLLQGVNAGFAEVVAKARREFLTTDARVRGSPPMPLAMREQIRRVPGVVSVVQRAYFAADYRPPYGVAAIATEPREFFALRPALAANEAGLATMERTRTGLLATPALLDMFGWKIGDTVTLRSRELRTDGSPDWPFVVAGTFDSVENPGTAALGVINYDYLDEARALNRGTVERFYIRIADPNRAIATAAAVDGLFSNSSHETWTRSDQERAEAQTKQMGDVAYFTKAIMAAVLFALLFLTGNAMRQAFQERTSEFAVLKALGYGDGKCLAIAVAEVATLYLIAAAVGLALAWLAAPQLRDIASSISVSWTVAAAGLGLAFVLALASVALPSWQLYRLPVARSLALR
jgi:putative ABC transport system permease protein